jgi:cysteine-rich PDZ-binding protein
MVCQDCMKKIEKTQKLITPEFTKKSSNYSLACSERKVNQNMILNNRKHMFDPTAVKCLICKGRVEGKNKYCLTCAYTKGMCEMCGVKVTDTKLYKFTDVDVKDAKRKNKMKEKTIQISNKILKDKKMIVDKTVNSEVKVKISGKKEDVPGKKIISLKLNKVSDFDKGDSYEEIDFEQNLYDDKNLNFEKNENDKKILENKNTENDKSDKYDKNDKNDEIDEYEYDEIIKI